MGPVSQVKADGATKGGKFYAHQRTVYGIIISPSTGSASWSSATPANAISRKPTQ